MNVGHGAVNTVVLKFADEDTHMADMLSHSSHSGDGFKLAHDHAYKPFTVRAASLHPLKQGAAQHRHRR